MPIATSIAARGINLPTHNNLQETDIQYIAGRVKEHLYSLTP
jgi:dTDP-4-amino-4,6-dideoxygalactose transaminase